MGKGTATSNSLLNLIYRAEAWANIADNTSTSPRTYIEVALHSGPVAAGDAQTVNEISTGAYARLQIARSAAGWEAASDGSLSNKALAQYVECSSGSATITHVSTGHGGVVLHSGALSASRGVSTGITMQFPANSLVVTES